MPPFKTKSDDYDSDRFFFKRFNKMNIFIRSKIQMQFDNFTTNFFGENLHHASINKMGFMIFNEIFVNFYEKKA